MTKLQSNHIILDAFDVICKFCKSYMGKYKICPKYGGHQTEQPKGKQTYTDDEYLFMANCTMAEFHNFLLHKWSNEE